MYMFQLVMLFLDNYYLHPVNVTADRLEPAILLYEGVIV